MVSDKHKHTQTYTLTLTHTHTHTRTSTRSTAYCTPMSAPRWSKSLSAASLLFLEAAINAVSSVCAESSVTMKTRRKHKKRGNHKTIGITHIVSKQPKLASQHMRLTFLWKLMSAPLSRSEAMSSTRPSEAARISSHPDFQACFQAFSMRALLVEVENVDCDLVVSPCHRSCSKRYS